MWIICHLRIFRGLVSSVEWENRIKGYDGVFFTRIRVREPIRRAERFGFFCFSSLYSERFAFHSRVTPGKKEQKANEL